MHKHPEFRVDKAIKIFREIFTKKTIATKVVSTFLALILTLNNFIFDSKHFLQIKGYEMATICALSYANILMDHFERKLIYPLIERKLSTYFRFIDDIFLTWTGASNQLFQFFKDLNNKKAPYIKSDNKALKNPTTFLDTEIYLRNDN